MNRHEAVLPLTASSTGSRRDTRWPAVASLWTRLRGTHRAPRTTSPHGVVFDRFLGVFV